MPLSHIELQNKVTVISLASDFLLPSSCLTSARLRKAICVLSKTSRLLDTDQNQNQRRIRTWSVM